MRTQVEVSYSINHKHFAKVMPKKWNSKHFSAEETFQRKKAKNVKVFQSPTNLRQGEISELRPRKAIWQPSS